MNEHSRSVFGMFPPAYPQQPFFVAFEPCLVGGQGSGRRLGFRRIAGRGRHSGRGSPLVQPLGILGNPAAILPIRAGQPAIRQLAIRSAVFRDNLPQPLCVVAMNRFHARRVAVAQLAGFEKLLARRSSARIATSSARNASFTFRSLGRFPRTLPIFAVRNSPVGRFNGSAICAILELACTPIRSPIAKS
jgi:hypothetical protein